MRARYIQRPSADEEEPSRRTANRTCENGRCESLDKDDLCRDHNSGRAPPRGTATDALATMGNGGHDVGSSAHKNREYEWQRLELCARIRRLPNAGGSAACAAP